MPAICPKCNTVLQLEQFPIKKDVQMNCNSCSTPLTISLVVSLVEETKTPKVTEPFEVSNAVGSGPKIVTLVEGDASNEMIREILSKNGYSVIGVPDVSKVFEFIKIQKPEVVIVDVGIPDLLGFEISEKFKKDPLLENIGVLLLASIHDATKYKREPDSLFGADDYIERHHIQDLLVPKIKAIIKKRESIGEAEKISTDNNQNSQPTATSSSKSIEPVDTQKTEVMEKALSIEQVFDTMLEEERNTSKDQASASAVKEPTIGEPNSMAADPVAHEAAKRLARIIISDIALYNQKAVEEGVKNGTFFEVLKDDISEGQKLYDTRVPNDIRSSTNYFKDSILNFIDKKKASF